LTRFNVGPTRAYQAAMIPRVRCLVLTLSAAAALSFCPRGARADSSDTLPSLDEGAVLAPPEPEPLPPPPPPAVLQDPSKKAAPRPLGPIRAQRRLALLGEVGWNGIAGFGPTLTYHVDPHFSVDLGAGLSLLGWKVGMRGRYNFLTGRVTPFVGAGMMGAQGWGDSPIPINDQQDPTRETVNVKILPSAWVQAVGGVDWIAPSGFNLVGAAGYAWVISHDPVQVVTGVPNAEERLAFDVVFRSNIVITVALGYSFR